MTNSKIDIRARLGEVGSYKLIDSGNKCKLEEVGGTRIVRSEPRAWWKASLPSEEWDKAQAYFDKENKGNSEGRTGVKWKFKENIPHEIEIEIYGLKVLAKFAGSSKHIGFFPEQSSEWEEIKETIERSVRAGREVNALNLFGYTGIASLVAAKAGASVTHVDGSEQSIEWARENQKLSELQDKPIRWILDDAMKFARREVKRGSKYDIIIIDPPSYGRGPKGDVWKAEDKLPELLRTCRELLSTSPLLIILNMYSTELSSISLRNMMHEVTHDLSGNVESGELVLKQQNSDRLLPMSIYSIWKGE
jgi:23S rRNA (cytosine1962-C5)-methyltransferase